VRYTVLPKLHLSRLQLSTRVLLSCFVLSVDVGLWVGSLKYTDRAVFSAAGARDYWHGAAPVSADPADSILPGESQISDAGEPPRAGAQRKSTKQLVDAVHPHLFSVPLVLFVLLHLISLTRLPEKAKVALHVHGFASFAATFGLPFWIAAEGRGAALFVVAGANLAANVLAASAIVLLATWRRPVDLVSASAGS
jgi:hypothetical protein